MSLRYFAFAWLFAFGCGPVAWAGELQLDDLFPRDRVLDIRITVAPADWDTLRHQSRDFRTAFSEARKERPNPSPYTYVEASVEIDGVSFPRVGLRKKGFFGSQSTSRPSLKIKLDHVDEAGGIGGLTKLTLNNDQQDTSLLSQYLGYGLFHAAGCPAPRVAFANVTVNGRNLGVYSHVESVGNTLLERGFGDATGPLYEGTIVDFVPGWEGSFEHKSGDDDAGRAKIGELARALDISGGRPLLSSDAEGRLWVPTNGDVDATWMSPDFDDSGWTRGRGGAGYETGTGYEALFRPEFDVREPMFGERSSVYLRYAFEVDDPVSIPGLVLGMKLDDGFVAYINGERVASANAPESLSWQSRAAGPGDDGAALEFQPFLLVDGVGALRPGRNVLAIHGLNVEPSSSDLLIVPELRVRDVDVQEAIAACVDLDAFFAFWALEGLLGFWDGYSGNRNNFFVYFVPGTGRFRFLPWGGDSLFQGRGPFERDPTQPTSVKTSGLVAHRLYQTEAGRERYRAALLRLLADHWKEDALLAEVDRLETLLRPFAERSPTQRNAPREMERVREYIRERRGEVMREIADGMPDWNRAPGPLMVFPANAPGGGAGAPPPPPDDLFAAARRGDLRAITKHLEASAVDARDRDGSTALMQAAGLGRIEALRLLIEKGADVNARNAGGQTALDQTDEPLTDQAAEFLSAILRLPIDPNAVNEAKPKIAELLRQHGAKRAADLVAPER